MIRKRLNIIVFGVVLALAAPIAPAHHQLIFEVEEERLMIMLMMIIEGIGIWDLGVRSVGE